MELVVPAVGAVAVCLSIGLAGLLTGYVWGRTTGRYEGQQLARTAAPIELRQLALERGICPICGSQPNKGTDLNTGALW